MTPDPIAVVRCRDVVRMTGLGRSTIYRMMRQGEFPEPEYRLTRNHPAWSPGQLTEWLESRRIRPEA